MLSYLKSKFSDRNPLRLAVHKLKAVLAAVFYGFPANKLIVIGVTGTNGKTTTVNFITDILVNAGEKVGMTSTVAFRIGDKKWVNATKKTTLDPFTLQKYLRQMCREGCKYAVVEVSSHAVTQSRIWGINFDVAAFTNVTAEHIEYHGSFDAYLRAKAKFFATVSNSKRKSFIEKSLVLNKDDESFEFFDKFNADRKFYYGLKNSPTITATDIVEHPRGTNFKIKIPNNVLDINLSLPGVFNVYNSLTAASVCLALNIEPKKIEAGLNSVKGVRGRFEIVPIDRDFDFIVDYAHTPEALENLFRMYKKLAQGRLISVFGATGGGRDKSKRPKMGAFAHEYSDVIILTNDDPYEEDEWEIISHIARGIPRKEGENFYKIADRREAIRMALMIAEKGDIIVLAGKGAEEKIMLHDGAHEWNDARVTLELCKRELNVEL